MLDFAYLDKYKENNRIEAKAASGGLPRSIWETYSSFANTFGGVILLGVEERPDHSLYPSGIEDPERIIREFWDIANNPQKVSINILSDKNVSVEEVDGKSIVAINVPRAERSDKPVYINNNPLSGTYRRNGEGDYKCSRAEVQSMLRDAAPRTQDMTVLEAMGLDVFDYDSIHRYRQRMKNYRPGHVWEELDDTDFLYKLGAVGRGSDNEIHPTTAGLLMFGHEYEIVKEFPDYFLDYQEQFDKDNRWTDRIISSSGDWSGNIYDFYFQVYNRLTNNIKVPFKIENGARIDDTSVHNALREAIANSLINADYYGKRGLVIIQTHKEIRISNPGAFRIEIEAAKAGGISDPRNTILMKMFNLIDIGERAGSGIPNIYSVWKSQGWNEPQIIEEFDPERITLILSEKEIGDKKSAINVKGTKSVAEVKATKSTTNVKGTKPVADAKATKSTINVKGTKPVAEAKATKSTINVKGTKSATKIGDKKSAIKQSNKEKIIEYLKKHSVARTSELADMLGLQSSRTRDYLTELIKDGMIISDGANKNKVYMIKKD